MGGLWRTLPVLVIAACVVHAQEDLEPNEAVEQDSLTQDQFNKMHGLVDSNKDGKISLEELLKFSEATRKVIAGKDIMNVIEELDTNKDGQLSIQEIMATDDVEGEGDEDQKLEAANRVDDEKRRFQIADVNRDGQLDQQELPALFYPETSDEMLNVVAESSLKSKDKDGDGLLTLMEFWEGDVAGSEDNTVADEEQAEFKALDKDGSGKLDVEELKAWESGRHHTEDAMRQLIRHTDKDGDAHITAAELGDARESISGTDAAYHFLEWAEHHEL
ncbi:unnamed protein product [Polarella glacialis]|uniref:EF-hand domain-containing protein n=1 Tax=Polarella glacialis TaxID=89957 RepID=A0A813DD62_POLGL|nr:unnamed protein product [Polarella glacialis]